VNALPAEVVAHQPRVRAALETALDAGPSHAYLFRGPRGSGKRAAARSFAGEILASAATDPDDTRRRALLDPSPHPDLVWLAPSGAQHLVEEVRERVIRAAVYRPFEGGRRVFVIEAAEALRDESQNALLKTLEEPPAFVHILLLSSEPEALLETVVSRCQEVEFAPLPPDTIEAALRGSVEDSSAERPEVPGIAGDPGRSGAEEVAAAARLAAGDLELARFLLGERGRELCAGAQRCAASVAQGAEDDEPPWRDLLSGAESAGEEAEAAAREVLAAEVEAGVKRSKREIDEEARRIGRRRRTEQLELGLDLLAAWFRDLAAVAFGAEEVALNRDRIDALRAQAAGIDAARARRAVELVQDTRRRLDLNVSEELALEALFSRLRRIAG